MYRLYHTPAIVLGSSAVGEGSKQVLFFTRELGLVSARAQGVRLARAKLRYHLTDFSYLDAWLVRGREVWRLANAVSRRNFFTDLVAASQAERRIILARLSALLRRLLPPEEAHPQLFDAVVSGCVALTNAERAEAEQIEILLALRILYHLGYVGEPREFLPVAESVSCGADDLSFVAPFRRRLVSVINSSLRLTGL